MRMILLGPLFFQFARDPLVSLCGMISGLTITDDQHPIYIYMIRIYSLCCFPIGFMRDDSRFRVPQATFVALEDHQSSLKPSTFSEGENIEIYLVQFSAQKSLGAAAQTWPLERKKTLQYFFSLLPVCGFFFFFQRYI